MGIWPGRSSPGGRGRQRQRSVCIECIHAAKVASVKLGIEICFSILECKEHKGLVSSFLPWQFPTEGVQGNWKAVCTRLLLLLIREWVQGWKHKFHVMCILPESHTFIFRHDPWPLWPPVLDIIKTVSLLILLLQELAAFLWTLRWTLCWLLTVERCPRCVMLRPYVQTLTLGMTAAVPVYRQ